MILRILGLMALTLSATPAAALCSGASYEERLSPAQQAELDSAVAAMPFAEGLTYIATRGEDQITLIGTMHIYDPRLEIIRARVSGFVRTAELVMLEATPVEEAQLQALLATEPERMFIVDGPTLPEILDEETWVTLRDAATARGIPGFLAAKMQPWYLALTLAVPPCAMEEMLAGATGLDKMIGADATAAGVPLAPLEPFTTLFDLMGDTTLDEQIEMLEISMPTEDMQQAMFVAMLDSYFAEDVGRLWSLSRIAMQDMPEIDPVEAEAMFLEMQEMLLDTRNRNWIPVIEAALKTRDTIVVAAGAAHLIGENGLLQLMTDDGWTVQRIP